MISDWRAAAALQFYVACLESHPTTHEHACDAAQAMASAACRAFGHGEEESELDQSTGVTVRHSYCERCGAEVRRV